jgi:hypothetical protein
MIVTGAEESLYNNAKPKLRRTENLTVCTDFETINRCIDIENTNFQVINSVLYRISIVVKIFVSSELSRAHARVGLHAKICTSILI